jgi:alkylhydroperoxidase family enzyme
MSWITPADAQTALEAALSHRPELLERYRAFYGSFWEDGLVPRQILELCRLRIAAIHDCDAEWQVRDAQVELTPAQLAGLRSGRFDAFAEDQRVALELAEQLPFAHHAVTDAQVAAVQDLLGEPGCVSLLTALAFFDVSCRLRLVLDLAAESAALEQPPLRDGALL